MLVQTPSWRQQMLKASSQFWVALQGGLHCAVDMQVFCAVQTALAPQSLLVRHATQVFCAAKQRGVEPLHCASEAHCTQVLFWQTRPPLQSLFETHCTQVRCAVQTRPAPQLALVTHSTQVFCGEQTRPPLQLLLSTHSTQK